MYGRPVGHGAAAPAPAPQVTTPRCAVTARSGKPVRLPNALAAQAARRRTPFIPRSARPRARSFQAPHRCRAGAEMRVAVPQGRRRQSASRRQRCANPWLDLPGTCRGVCASAGAVRAPGERRGTSRRRTPRHRRRRGSCRRGTPAPPPALPVRRCAGAAPPRWPPDAASLMEQPPVSAASRTPTHGDRFASPGVASRLTTLTSTLPGGDRPRLGAVSFFLTSTTRGHLRRNALRPFPPLTTVAQPR